CPCTASGPFHTAEPEAYTRLSDRPTSSSDASSLSFLPLQYRSYSPFHLAAASVAGATLFSSLTRSANKGDRQAAVLQSVTSGLRSHSRCQRVMVIFAPDLSCACLNAAPNSSSSVDNFASPQISFSIAECAAAQLKLAARADGTGRTASNVIV